jgi:phenylacetate-coenzyme A ligase PaaK-like adenylate-forming protein
LDTIVRRLRDYYSKNKPRRTGKWGIRWTKTNPERQANQLRRFQLRKLKNTLEYVYEFSPYYQKNLTQ